MTNFNELADRCEKATGADRNLDAQIWASWQGVELLEFDCSRSNTEVFSYDGALRYPDWPAAGHYTASIDDAMTLVPKGYWTTLDHFCMSDIPGKTKWRTFLNRHFEIADRDYLQKSLSVALTPALSLCGAALRARAVTVSRPTGGDAT